MFWRHRVKPTTHPPQARKRCWDLSDPQKLSCNRRRVAATSFHRLPAARWRLHDRAERMRTAQSDRLLGFAAIVGFENAVAGNDVVANVRFTGANVKNLGVRSRDGDGANA